jgi:hypothetical protein
MRRSRSATARFILDNTNRAPKKTNPAMEIPMRTATTTEFLLYKSVYEKKAITRADCDPGEVYPALARDILIHETTGLRAMSREMAVKAALFEEYVEPLEEGTARTKGWYQRCEDLFLKDSETRKMLRALLELELHGTGGHGGYSGGTTRRMSWATGLGKGRHHASDGGAYDAAINSVARQLETTELVPPEDVTNLLGVLPTQDLEWVEAYATWRMLEETKGLCPSQAHKWAAVIAAAHREELSSLLGTEPQEGREIARDMERACDLAKLLWPDWGDYSSDPATILSSIRQRMDRGDVDDR